MGYYTTYEFGTKGNKYKVKDIASYIKEELYDKSNGNKFYPFSYELDLLFLEENIYDFELHSDDTKWYRHDEEMLELSKQFPETVFYLYGVGEDNNDMWYKYYKNGKSQYCPAKITYDEYDKSKLV